MLPIKWMGIALVTQHIVNTSQEDEGNTVLAIEGTPTVTTRQSASVIKVSGHNDVFKRRLVFSFTVIISA